MKSLISFALLTLIWSAAAAEDFALAQLNSSPRHHEYVAVKNGDRSIRTFVVYPETKKDTPAVLIIHENRGLTDWVRSFADQIAEAGYVAVAPDLLSDFSDEIKNTSEFKDSDAAREAIYELNDDQVISDLKAVRDYAAKLKSSNGKIAVAGFCWGGAKSFLLATREKNIKAVFTFYGSPPESKNDLKNISAKIYGFYGEDDNRINSQLPETEEKMKELKKFYEVEIYRGAGHAFMRHGDDPQGSRENKIARGKAWHRLKNILSKL